MRLVARIAESRKTWPAWLSRAFDAVVALVPEPIALRVNPARYGFSPSDVPPPPTAPATKIRLYIAPVNFAGQGYRWARASELLPGVGAVSMQYRSDRDYGFPSDNAVPVRVFRNSRRWQQTQFDAVSSGFSHVIYEAGRPIFGELYGLSPLREIEALRQLGARVAMLSHGSDLRLPSRHREIDEWSPFHEKEWVDIPVLEDKALRHRELLSRVGAPVFVSSPDLLLDWPDAHWLPTVVDVANWRCEDLPLERARPVVVHAPSRSVVKGSDLIEPVMRNLHDEGLIEYRRVEGVPAAQMPALYRSADIVLDQFRVGNYGVAAVESMAAGRLVVAHTHEQVRDHVVASYGLPVPIVQATVDSLESTVRGIVADRDRYRAIASSGPGFVHLVHDGRASAEALRPFLLGV